MNLEQLISQKKWGVVLDLEIGGYRMFCHNESPAVAQAILVSFAEIVRRVVSPEHGVIKRRSSEVLEVSYHLNCDEIDLSDIPGIEAELIRAEENSKLFLIDEAERTRKEICSQFNQIKKQLNVKFPIQLKQKIKVVSVENPDMGKFKATVNQLIPIEFKKV